MTSARDAVEMMIQRRIDVAIEAMRADLGDALSDDDLRRAATALERIDNVGVSTCANLPRLPAWAGRGVVGRARLGLRAWGWSMAERRRWAQEWSQQFHVAMSETEEIEISAWDAYRGMVVAPAWGRDGADTLIAELRADPDRRIGGYLADSILSWQSGRSGYEGCSGCDYIEHIRMHCRDLWDWLLTRAPIGGIAKDGSEQTFPHERERMARLRAAGYSETLRLSDSVWTPPGAAT